MSTVAELLSADVSSPQWGDFISHLGLAVPASGSDEEARLLAFLGAAINAADSYMERDDWETLPEEVTLGVYEWGAELRRQSAAPKGSSAFGAGFRSVRTADLSITTGGPLDDHLRLDAIGERYWLQHQDLRL